MNNLVPVGVLSSLVEYVTISHHFAILKSSMHLYPLSIGRGGGRRTKPMISQSFGYRVEIKIKNNTYLASPEHIGIMIRKYNRQPVLKFCLCYK